jgi:hypothetical protein
VKLGVNVPVDVGVRVGVKLGVKVAVNVIGGVDVGVGVAPPTTKQAENSEVSPKVTPTPIARIPPTVSRSPRGFVSREEVDREVVLLEHGFDQGSR